MLRKHKPFKLPIELQDGKYSDKPPETKTFKKKRKAYKVIADILLCGIKEIKIETNKNRCTFIL